MNRSTLFKKGFPIKIIFICLNRMFKKLIVCFVNKIFADRHLCISLRGSHLPVSSHPPDMSPILAADLPAAFAERHKDSDYGFQQEFEVKLQMSETLIFNSFSQ